MQGFKLLWSKANGRSLFDHRSDRVYMYLYAGCVTLTLTLTLIRRLKFTYGEYIQVRRKFIYTYVYIRYVYIRRIYTYTVWANPTYAGRVCMCRFWSCVISALETFSGLHALLTLKLWCSWCCCF